LRDLFNVIEAINKNENLTSAQKTNARAYIEQIIRLQVDKNYRREYEKAIIASIN
jgi:hypothetical protein